MHYFEPADISIYIQGRGIILKEKSLIAYNETSGKILAYGGEAVHAAENTRFSDSKTSRNLINFFAFSPWTLRP